MFLARLYPIVFVLSFLIFTQGVKTQTIPEPFKFKSRIDFPSKTVIGHVLPLDGHAELAAYFDGFMLRAD